MLLEIISKLISESLLSLYPVFIKKINLPLLVSVWSRFITYFIISIFFVNWKYIYNNILTVNGIQLFIVTMLHVYTSYKAFKLLDSGVAYVIFYTYPLIILIMAKQKIHPILLLAVIGVYLLSVELDTNKTDEKENETNKTIQNIYKKYEGIFMGILAAITEAFIFFIVRKLKTDNNWNHMLISYGGGAIILSIYFIYKYFVYGDTNIINNNINVTENNIDNKETYINIDIANNTNYNKLLISITVNAFIGLVGYLLRFYAMSKLDATTYAPLSYFGILMAYIYGIIFNKETLTIKKIIGSLLIVMSNLYILYN